MKGYPRFDNDIQAKLLIFNLEVVSKKLKKFV